MECHSPIISLVNETPAIYVRQPSDTIKGQMYYDLELSDWIFEIDHTYGAQIADRLMEIYRSYPESLEKVKQLNQRVKSIYDQSMEQFRSMLKNK
jgi:polysaccharide pyruvyl transferase WcaK-like protein